METKPAGTPARRRTRPSGRALAIVLTAFLVPGAAFAAATVKGRTVGQAKLQNPVWNEARDPGSHRYTFREPSPTVRPDVRTLTGYMPKELCVVALGEKGVANKVPLLVVVAGGRLSPVTLVVAEGQQVLFENRDPFPHKIFEASGKAGFQAGDMQPTKSRTWTPPGPGKYEIRDESSPSIRGWIVVEPRAAAVAYPDRKGEFAMDLEPGSYKLRGYYSGEPVGNELAVEVTPAPAEQPLKAPLVLGDVGDAGTGGK